MSEKKKKKNKKVRKTSPLQHYFWLLFAYLSEHTIDGNVELAVAQFKEFFEIVEKSSPSIAESMRESLIEFREKRKEWSNLVDPTKPAFNKEWFKS